MGLKSVPITFASGNSRAVFLAVSDVGIKRATLLTEFNGPDASAYVMVSMRIR
jgi:hypothetical protein